MDLTKQDAAAALHDIEQARASSRELKGYEMGGPYLIVWGMVWLVAGSLADLLPRSSGMIWSTGNVLGIIASIWLARRDYSGDTRGRMRRFLGLMAICALFMLATRWLIDPAQARKFLAFSGMFTGAVYMAAGLWIGTRFILCGAAVVAASLTGYAILPSHFQLWFAVACGGAMILSGFWMRRS